MCKNISGEIIMDYKYVLKKWTEHFEEWLHTKQSWNIAYISHGNSQVIPSSDLYVVGDS